MISNFTYYAKQEEWVKSYGSSRLKKALQADMLDSMNDVYEAERIKQEFGDKCVLMSNTVESSWDVDNATEEQIDFVLSFDPKTKPKLLCLMHPTVKNLAVVFSVDWTNTKIVSYLPKNGE
jgi:hypothetical protein